MNGQCNIFWPVVIVAEALFSYVVLRWLINKAVPAAGTYGVMVLAPTVTILWGCGVVGVFIILASLFHVPL